MITPSSGTNVIANDFYFIRLILPENFLSTKSKPNKMISAMLLTAIVTINSFNLGLQ